MQLCNGSPVVLDAIFIDVLRIKNQKDDWDPKKTSTIAIRIYLYVM